MNTVIPQEVMFRRMRLSDVEQVHKLEENIFPTPWSMKSYQFEVAGNMASDPRVAVLNEGENESKIVEELNAAQGIPIDIKGYHKPNDQLKDKVMRPSATFNTIIDAI